VTPPVEAARRAPAVACRAVRDDAERALHLEIRRQVFVGEQGFFRDTDRDGHDDDPATVHVLGLCDGVAAGAVRLYPLDEPGEVPGTWKGDRLAVLPAFRSQGVGGPLVRFAVRTAAEAGGRVMVAHIQPANVTFFERLGWRRAGGLVSFVGRPHQMMTIDLQPLR
jgi:putative N-acetyltransferase (TIGR04045 family)